MLKKFDSILVATAGIIAQETAGDVKMTDTRADEAWFYNKSIGISLYYLLRDASAPMTPFTEMDIDDGQTTVDEDRIGEVKRDQPVLRETNIEPNKILESVPSNGVASNVEKLGQQSDTVASFSLPVPEPEMLLSVNDLLAQFTPEKEVSEEGGNGLKNPSGQKRQLMESALVQRYGSSTILSGIPHSKRIVDSIPDDDDLLSSILGNILITESLHVLSTLLHSGLLFPFVFYIGLLLVYAEGLLQSPTEIASRKQPRITPRASVVKRKVLLDDTMVLHGEYVFVFLSMSVDLIGLQNRIFDVTESREVPGEVMWSSATSLIGEANTEGPDEPVAAGGGEANESTATIVLVDSQLCEEHLSDHIDSGVMEKSNGVQTVLPNDGNLDTQFVEKDAFIMQRCNYRDDAVNGSEVNKEGLHLDKGVPMENDRSAQEISESCSVKVMLQDVPQEVDACEVCLSPKNTMLEKCSGDDRADVPEDVSATLTFVTDYHFKEGIRSESEYVTKGENVVDVAGNSSAFMCIEDPQRDFSCQSEFKITTETVPFDEFENQGSQEADLAGNSSWLSADLGGIMAAETTSLYNASLETPCDLGNTLDGNDTGFLNFNDEDTVEEDNGIPNAEEVGILDNSGWSSIQ
ncbi:hypothetical protein IFM89_004790, partial [Coptis chinensis]